jgi:phosphate transport system substrate-binding protein
MVADMRVLALIACLLMPLAAAARDQIRVVGSSTVFPFTAAAAEQFGREGQFRTPIVESTGTGGGFKIFCGGLGEEFADLADASRAIKPEEIESCHQHGIDNITELTLGYDGIVIASARNGAGAFPLSKRQLFLALARRVPKDGKLVPNFYQRWRQIDPALPDLAIEIYGPPPTEGTRDALGELLMDAGCKQFPEFAAAYPDSKERSRQCTAMREDGRFVELLGGNLMVQKLINDKGALAIFGYSFLEQNGSLVEAHAIDGAAPDFANIVSGRYGLARSLYVYVKNDHVGQVPGLREFVTLLASDAASGPDGFLVLKGLLPLPDDEHEKMKRVAYELTPLETDYTSSASRNFSP